MQFYEINICQAMIFRLSTVYNKHEMRKNGNWFREKSQVQVLVASARIILQPTVSTLSIIGNRENDWTFPMLPPRFQYSRIYQNEIFQLEALVTFYSPFRYLWAYGKSVAQSSYPQWINIDRARLSQKWTQDLMCIRRPSF